MDTKKEEPAWTNARKGHSTTPAYSLTGHPTDSGGAPYLVIRKFRVAGSEESVRFTGNTTPGRSWRQGNNY